MKALKPRKYNQLLAESLKGIGIYLLIHKLKLSFSKNEPKCKICDSTDIYLYGFCYDCFKEHYS